MHLHRSTRWIFLVVVALGAAASLAGTSTAQFEDQPHIGQIVVFRWYGWPEPLVHGAFPYAGTGTPSEALDAFLWGENSHAWFAIAVRGVMVLIVAAGIAALVEFLWRQRRPRAETAT